MENKAFEDESDKEEIFESFVCCVCLDLLYKPIVLSCGHTCCFWCVFKSMNGQHESSCPVCRQPYYHFPTICQMLHFLLLKIYPLTSERRENQMLEEEKKMSCDSPRFDDYTRGSPAKFDHPVNSPSCTIANTIPNSHSMESFEDMEQSATTTHKGDEDTIYYECSSEKTPEVIKGKKLPQNEHDQQQKISVADAMCTTCKQLLFHPVVLNCGHVYCETCVINLTDEMLTCKVCQSPHPRGVPKVCLALDHFLEEQFPEEYAQRRDTVQQSQIKVKPETTSPCSPDTGKGKWLGWWFGRGSKIHRGVGCDFCGVFPITGDRYRCIDCTEWIGFDLCGYCYNTGSKRPGRFSQQHTSEHKFELIR